MSHYLAIDGYAEELRLKLICTATTDAPCRMRDPSDPDREEWHEGDPDLTPGHPCWAVEWSEEAGWESVASATDVEWPRIPVTVEYDEGVIVAPVAPQPDLFTEPRADQ